MAKRNREKRKAARVSFDSDMAARWQEILRLREQIKKALAKRKTKSDRLH